MRRDSSVMWVYALAFALLATFTVARCAPDPARTTADSTGATTELVPYEGWWKDRPQ